MHKYEILPINDRSFSVELVGGPFTTNKKIKVAISDNNISYEITKIDTNSYVLNSSSFYGIHFAIKTIADTIRICHPASHSSKKKFKGYEKWLTAKIGQNISRRIRDELVRIRQVVPQNILDVQKRVFGQTGHPYIFKESLVGMPEVYNNKYFVSDVMKYRAAAVLMSSDLSKLGVISTYTLRDLRTPAYHYDRRNPKLTEDVSEWMGWLSPTGKTYTNLTKTLMNLPGRIHPDYLSKLKQCCLPRAVANRTELLTILNWPGDRNRDVVLHATQKEIKKAYQLFHECFNETNPSLNKLRVFGNFTSYLYDFPEAHNGNIINLARRSIEWHRQFAVVNAYDITSESVPDDVVLPVNNNTNETLQNLLNSGSLVFLDTAGKVKEEGNKMRHCVGSMLNRIVKGELFIYHFSHNGDEATAAFDSNGNLSQVQGPGNKENGASKYLYNKIGRLRLQNN